MDYLDDNKNDGHDGKSGQQNLQRFVAVRRDVATTRHHMKWRYYSSAGQVNTEPSSRWLLL
jgi:hypothetical protein